MFWFSGRFVTPDLSWQVWHQFLRIPWCFRNNEQGWRMNHSSPSTTDPQHWARNVSGLLRPSHPSLIQKLKIKLMQLVQEKGAVRLRIFGLNDSGWRSCPQSDMANWWFALARYACICQSYICTWRFTISIAFHSHLNISKLDCANPDSKLQDLFTYDIPARNHCCSTLPTPFAPFILQEWGPVRLSKALQQIAAIPSSAASSLLDRS